MAQPIATGAIWQMTIEYTMNQQILLNTFHYLQDGGVADYPTFAAQWDTWNLAAGHMIEALLPAITGAATVTGITYQPIRPSRYRPVKVIHSLSGSQAGQDVPQNVAQVITRAGVLANKHNLGSIHLPPPQADQIVGGSLDVGQVALLNVLASRVLQVVAPGGGGVTLTPVLISRNVVLTPQPLTIAFGQVTARIMRRRTVRLGI